MILPEIYIDKITLENNVYTQTKDNPHIKEDLSFDVDENVFGTVSFIQRPDIVELLTTPPESLSVNVEVSIKDLTRQRQLFSDQMFKKYVKIGVVSITNDKSLSIILSSNNRQTIDRLASQRKGVKQKIFDIDPSGSVGNSYFFRHQFDYSRTKNNLVIMAYVFVDLDRLEQDYNADILANLNDFKFAAENVIDNGEVSNTSYIFRDLDGALYSGPVSFDRARRTFTKFGTSEILEQSVYPNSTVCDMRKVKNLSIHSLDYSLEEELLESALNKNLEGLKQELRQSSKFNQSYFSDLYITRDEQNNARGFFSINYNEIIRTKTNFGYILNRESFADRKDQILKSTRIKELKIYRRRVKKTETVDSIGNSVTKYRDFSRDQHPVLVAYISEKSYNSTVPTNGSKGGIRELFPGLGSDYRLFSFMDYDVSNTTDGIYQYYVELSVEDNTTKFIEEQLKTLREALGALDSYKTAADDPRFYGDGTSFSPEFIRLLRESSFYTRDGENLWTFIVSRFLEASNNLYKDFDNSIFNTMLDLLRPETANQETLQIVSDVLLTYISRVERHIVRVTSEDANVYPKQTPIYKTRILDDISIVKYFDVVFDANTVKNTGLDFLTYFEEDGSKVKFEDSRQGLISLTAAQYDQRTKKEAQKYFKDISGNVKIGTDRTQYLDTPIESERFSSLAPSVVKTGGASMSMLNGLENWSPTRSKELEKKIAKASTETTSELDLGRLSKFSVSMVSDDNSEIGIDSNSIFGAGSNLNNSFDESRDEKKSFSVSVENLALDSNRKISSVPNKKKALSKALDIKSSENIVDKSGRTKLVDMPLQLKSVLSYTSLANNVSPNTILKDGTVSDIDLSNNFIFKFNYGILNKIEYLAGFAENTRLPIWESLTKEVIQNTSREIVCRMRRYENSEIEMYDAKDIPQYNEYFIIRVTVGTVENASPAPETTFRRSIIESVESIDTELNFVSPSLLNNGVFTF